MTPPPLPPFSAARPHPRRARRGIVVLTTVVALLAGPLAGIAAAHVSVVSPGATQGAYTTITFQVPTESDSPTTKVEVAMPTDDPIASVRVQPKDGWSHEVVTAAPATPISDDDGPITEIVTRVIWTATGPGILPGEFDTFTVSAGPLPTTDAVVFKVLQTYGDGTVVSWIQEPVAGAEEPEFPAPTLALAAAVGDTPAAAATSGDVPAVTTVTASTESGGGATTLSIVSLVLAVLAALGAGYAVLLTRRPGRAGS